MKTEWELTARRIVERCQYEEVDINGEPQILDLFTASALCQVLDAISPTNRKRLQSMPLELAISTTWRTLKASRA